MKQEQCFQLGFILKPHGIAGELQAQIEAESPQDYIEMESVFVEINKKLIPFFIDSLTINRNKAIIKFEDIDSIEEATPFSGKKLFIPLTALPELEEDQFYYHEIIGYTISDRNLGEIGPILEVYENPGHDLIGVDYKGTEVLIPFADDIILSVDHAKKLVESQLPQGLLDIYLNEKENEKEQDED